MTELFSEWVTVVEAHAGGNHSIECHSKTKEQHLEVLFTCVHFTRQALSWPLCLQAGMGEVQQRIEAKLTEQFKVSRRGETEWGLRVWVMRMRDLHWKR